MKIMRNAVRVAAVLSIGALALGSLAAPALADEARIHTGDLNLDSPQGRAEFDKRVKVAAERLCWNEIELSLHRACVSAFTEAAAENLTAQQTELARQQGGNVTIARR